MYAIVEIAGKQFRVEEKSRLRVPLLNVENGKKVEFDKVLAYNDDKGLTLGSPLVDKISVSATVVEHGREKKVIVFKKKRRKGYQKKNGHRQDYSLIEVNSIGAASSKPKTESKPKAAAKPKAEVKTKTEEEAPKAAPKAKTEDKPKAAPKTKAKAKSTASEKTTAKKPAAKKAAPKKSETKKEDKEA